MANRNPGAGLLTQGRENFLWLVADKGVRLIAGVLVGLLVARYLGPRNFGLLAYAGSIVALLLPVAELGVDAVVRRKLVTNPEDASRWLGVTWWSRLVVGATLAMVIAAWSALARDDGSASVLILILSISLLQPAGMTADLWLQANLKAKRATIATWVTLAAGGIIRLWLVSVSASLTSFAWVSAVEGILNCLLIWIAARSAGMPPVEKRWNLSYGRELARVSWPLLLSAVTVMLYMRVDVVMLRKLLGDADAGVYAAAVRLSELWYFLPGALASSLLPKLLRDKAAGHEVYVQAMQRYYDLSAALGYTLAVGASVLAGPLVRWAFGSGFAEAEGILRWHAWGAVFVFLGVARGQFLVNENMTRFYLLATTLGAGLNIALNLWLIPMHGPIGAAWASVVSYGLAAYGASWLHPRVRENAAMQTRALLVPLVFWKYLRAK